MRAGWIALGATIGCALGALVVGRAALLAAAEIGAAALALGAAESLRRGRPRTTRIPDVARAVRTSLGALRRDGRAAPGRARAAVAWATTALFLTLTAAVRLGQAALPALPRPAQAGGLYGARRPVQVALLLACLALAIGLFALGRRALGALGRRSATALAIGAGLLAWTAARSVSLHELDAILGAEVGGLPLNGLLEGALTAAVAGLAFTARRDAVREGAPRR